MSNTVSVACSKVAMNTNQKCLRSTYAKLGRVYDTKLTVYDVHVYECTVCGYPIIKYSASKRYADRIEFAYQNYLSEIEF